MENVIRNGKKIENNASASTKVHALSLIVAAIGILIEYIVGVPGFPTVPPGPIILGLAGIMVFVIVTRWKWILIISEILVLFITTGGIIEGSSWDRLGKITDFGPFFGTALQWIGMTVAIIAGIFAFTVAFRRASAT
jgi:hypothetical protein